MVSLFYLIRLSCLGFSRPVAMPPFNTERYAACFDEKKTLKGVAGQPETELCFEHADGWQPLT
jgi:hypothetical protein